MAKSATDAVLDGSLDIIQQTAKRMFVCTTAALTNYTEASATYMLAQETLTSADFTIGPGDSSGRKVAVTAQSSVSISVTGTAGQVAICTTEALLIVTNCTTQALTTGGTVTIPTFDYESAAPV